MAITVRRWLIAGGVVTLALLMACPAQAAFPGANGKLAVSSAGDLHYINPDGTGDTPVASNVAHSAWSPDGKRIAFDQVVGGAARDIYVMNSDGSGQTALTSNPAHDANPAWSPDGTKIVFESTRDGNSELYVMNADGSAVQRITSDAAVDRDPAWSPDGTKVAFASDRQSYTCEDPEDPSCYVRPTFRIFTMAPDGSGVALRVSTAEPFDCFDGVDVFAPDWSSDGASIVYESIELDRCLDGYQHGVRTDGPGGRSLYFETDTGGAVGGTAWSPDGREIAFRADTGGRLMAVRPDGSGARTIASCCHRFPSWQPIPVNAYPRPKGASPMDASLVPAYEPCASPNRTHGPPLAFGSCSPPARAPGQLTVGTPDANGQGARSVASVRMNPRPGDATTSADEADVVLRASITDVRLRSDLSDYTGSLEMRMSIQITDKDNTPHPGGPGPATVQELTQSYPLPCTGTADTTVGSTCGFDTTIEAFVPGAVKELRRAIWHLGTIRVHDGAGNLFLTQGIWVP